ncbi:serine/threonine-protein phosphatase 6 regulatory subunit 3 isoform X2 [Lingula anatina]|uniref:Serine/threonine-protein phosphatase 6 regulatory subunit 3 isoform X2 n=1 Tax=Lingula anatina TaxID=7574 RepID=A0A1S3K5G3_LINAN|nr:serine/threonine-protein phosphatase 6 regulatory subunit 3 isoform X2 [Lingula anatina]|eukprot:XP_013417752.1 serine/threonine-protein phosphatase 6 regulatory subunit 3 isoform X2 [Lingula anatina]
MFWKFHLLNSHIDTLLDKEDVTLHELMDEDDVLQECKAQNRKLLDFLIRPEVMEEMVNLVTTEPDESLEDKVKYKYPNTACELLTSDVAQITERLVADEALLAKIYGFLEAEGPLNPLLASFFSKIMGLLINKKSEFMLDYLKSRDNFVGNLLHHIGTSAIMDLLLRLITCVEIAETRNAILNWLNEEKLIQKLVAMIDPSEDEEKQSNASQSLCDIIRLSREQMSQLQDKCDPDPLLATVEAQDTVSDLLCHMFNGEKKETVLTDGLTVIQCLIEFRKTGPEGLQEEMTPLDAERLALGVSNTLMAVTPRLKDFHQVLLNPPKQKYSAMPTTVGSLDPPLGNSRLHVARLVTSLLLTNTNAINSELANLGTMNVLLDLHFKYIWNNFLHTQLEQCVYTILTNTPTENEGKQENVLLDQLFLDCRIVQRILESFEINEQDQSRPGGRRRGHMGHTTKIANDIVDCMDKGNNSDHIKQIFKELDEDVRQKWERFTSGVLAEVNKKNTVELGGTPVNVLQVGGHPLHSSSEDDDADFRDIPFPQDTALQQLQQMTSNFIDQFGFNDEEFAEQDGRIDAPFTDRISSIDFNINASEDNPSAAMFEQVCNEKIQPFDDNDSDEDIWEDKEVTFSSPTQLKPSLPANLPTRSTGVSSQGSDDEEEEAGSSSSEEELDSPVIIRQTPSIPVAEKMDVDSNDAWPNDVAMGEVPVAMDTVPAGWGNAAGATAKEDNWADFSNANTSTTSNSSTDNWAAFGSSSPSQSAEDNWADFANFTPTKVKSESGPRSSSPIAMDTEENPAEGANARHRVYLSASAPPDLSSVMTEAKHNENTNAGDDNLENDENKNEEDKNEIRLAEDSKRDQSPGISSSPEISVAATNTKTDKKSEEVVSNEVQQQPDSPGQPFSSKDPGESKEGKGSMDENLESEEKDLFDFDDDDDDDLADNFNFLAGAGLMKKSSLPNSVETINTTDIQGNGPTEGKEESDSEKIKKARAQAMEALEQYESATSTPTSTDSTSSNGPV